LSKLTVWAILFFFILSFGLYALYQSEAGSGDELLRSGSVTPSVLPNDLQLPESETNDLSEEVAVPDNLPTTPVPEVPAAEGTPAP